MYKLLQELKPFRLLPITLPLTVLMLVTASDKAHAQNQFILFACAAHCPAEWPPGGCFLMTQPPCTVDREGCNKCIKTYNDALRFQGSEKCKIFTGDVSECI